MWVIVPPPPEEKQALDPKGSSLDSFHSQRSEYGTPGPGARAGTFQAVMTFAFKVGWWSLKEPTVPEQRLPFCI